MILPLNLNSNLWHDVLVNFHCQTDCNVGSESPESVLVRTLPVIKYRKKTYIKWVIALSLSQGLYRVRKKDRKPRVTEPPSFAPCLTSLRAVPRHKAYPIWTWWALWSYAPKSQLLCHDNEEITDRYGILTNYSFYKNLPNKKINNPKAVQGGTGLSCVTSCMSR